MIKSTLGCWIALVGAICFEVLGSAAMKLGHTNNEIGMIKGLILTYLLISISYLFLAKAVRKIPVTIAYAFWEGLGLILIAAVSFLVLGETISLPKFLGLVAVLAGVILVERGVHK